jgi:hypothetical protein
VEELEAESRLHTITVPKHVHLLRVVKGEKSCAELLLAVGLASFRLRLRK